MIVGKSGSGKTSIANALEERYGYKQLKSYSTRKPRFREDDSHVFVSWEEFENLEDKVAFTIFDGHGYCATKQQVEESDTYIIDLVGVERFKELYDGNKTIKVVFIDVPWKERYTRMRERGDGIWTAVRRLLHDARVFRNAANKADMVFYNHKFEQTVRAIKYYMMIVEAAAGVEEWK